jgi:hypothetical protein
MGKPSLKDLRRQIPAFRAAERAIGDDPCVRHRLDWRGNVLVASFADNHKGMNARGRDVVDEDIIGEYKAKISTGTLHAEQVIESECLFWGRASCTRKAERSLEIGKPVASQCAVAARHPSGEIICQTATAGFGNLSADSW